MKKFTIFTLALVLSLAVFVSSVDAKEKVPSNIFTGGGQIVDGDYNISFGGMLKELITGETRGQMQVNFHNVSDLDVNGGTFHSTDVADANWFAPDTATCTSAMNATFMGRFNNEDGWSLIFRAGDNDDTVRVELYNTDNIKVYESNGDFPNESSCVGTARTGLDNGNLKIRMDY